MNYLEFFKAFVAALCYSNVDEDVEKWLKLKPDKYGSIKSPLTRFDAGSCKSLLWVTIVKHCGKYETSPRYGWIPKENITKFYEVLNTIKRCVEEEG